MAIVKKVTVTLGGKEVEPQVGNLTRQGASPAEILAAALKTALEQNAIVKVNNAKEIGKGSVTVTPLPED